jgi:hypothetical protein
MNHRDLEAVRQIVNKATGLDIMYAYDDLVFPEHGAFIIRFSDSSDDELFCHFHQDCTEMDEKNIFNSLKNECAKIGGDLEKGNSYTLDQKDENVQIIFNE